MQVSFCTEQTGDPETVQVIFQKNLTIPGTAQHLVNLVMLTAKINSGAYVSVVPWHFPCVL